VMANCSRTMRPARYSEPSLATAICRECKLIWRSESDVGVKFIQRSAQDYFY
jgi:hypothetical protein